MMCFRWVVKKPTWYIGSLRLESKAVFTGSKNCYLTEDLGFFFSDLIENTSGD